MLSALSGISENVWEGYVCLFSQWGRFIFHFAELIDRCSYWQDEAIDTDIAFSAVFIKAQKYRKKKCVIGGTIYILSCMWGNLSSIHPKAYICVSQLQPLVVVISIKCNYETVRPTGLVINVLAILLSVI